MTRDDTRIESAIRQLQRLLPEAFVDGRIDWARLQQKLGDEADTAREGFSCERYGLSWVGKREAMRSVETSAASALAPCRDESVAFETTSNVFVEGDNLEVLKQLRRAYGGQIKMIYIDPPYNTGNDYAYPDNFAVPLADYLRRTGQLDRQGRVLTDTPETAGRFHSAWLSMMYPRLALARELLQEDGVIFVSIDDDEVHNLRLLLNEIFGEQCFCANVIWQKKPSPQSDATYLSDVHDHVLVYAKTPRSGGNGASGWVPNSLPWTDVQLARYKNRDASPRGPWAPGDLTCNKTSDQRPNLYYPITNPNTGEEVWPRKQRVWTCVPERMRRLMREDRLWWGYKGDGFPRMKRFLAEIKPGMAPGTLWTRDEVGDTAEAARELRGLFPETYGVFDTPKPTRLIRRMLQLSTSPTEEDIVMDFFSGSCTTAHAVLELNRIDGGRRRFIMVQLPEPLAGPIELCTAQAGNQGVRASRPGSEPSDRKRNGRVLRTIADVGKERIRRAIARMAESESPKRGKPLDEGFRVFKTRSERGTTLQGAGRAIWEVAVEAGYPLDSHTERVAGPGDQAIHRVWHSERNDDLYVCLGETVILEQLGALPLEGATLFVCRDTALNAEARAYVTERCQLRTL